MHLRRIAHNAAWSSPIRYHGGCVPPPFLFSGSQLQLYRAARIPRLRLARWLQQSGYRIVVNVGDQRSDLTGGYALKTFKLPNPSYYIP